MNQIAMAFDHAIGEEKAVKMNRGGKIMGFVLDTVGKLIAGYLQKEVPGYEPFTPSDPEHLRGIIQEGDVWLIEGNNRVSGIIKYLTQSTWSHAALYVGPIDGASEPDGEPHVLIEANIGEGVTSAPLSKYFPYHTRLCRPVGLSWEDRNTVCRYAINRIGFGYDTKNILDLMRYSDSAAGAAALAAADDRVRLRRSHKDHLLGADRAGVRRGALSDPAQDHPRRLQAGKARNPSYPRFVAVHAARFRHLALFRNRQAHDRRGF